LLLWEETMKENLKIKRWELSLSPMGMVHLHYETLLSNVLQDGMGGLARELHQLAAELNRLGSTRKLRGLVNRRRES
jgi:hypothetical protein